jgi:transposase
MQDIELYREILGLEAPWRVERVDLNLSEQSVLIYVEYDTQQATWCCPECQQTVPVYDHREPRQWRHLDTCQLQTILVASLPRVNCPEHGVQTVRVSWSQPNSRFTHLFERLALDVLRATKVQAQAAQLLRLSAGQLHDLMHRAVNRGLSRRNQEQARPHLSLDEKSFQKGHKYVSVLSDPDGKCVLEVVEGRDLEAVQTLLTTSLTPKQREQVLSVSMDMWPAFDSARAELLPQADTVHDRYHVVSYLNTAVDMTRRAEHKALSKQQDTTLSRSKYLWLRSPETMTDKQKMAFAALSGLELETAKVWMFKENFRQFFACHTEYGARSFFERWYQAALILGNTHLTKVAEMLNRHLTGLLAYIRHRVTNGTAEGLNSQVQLIKANARGFRRFNNFRVAILFFLGKLDLYPHKSP